MKKTCYIHSFFQQGILIFLLVLSFLVGNCSYAAEVPTSGFQVTSTPLVSTPTLPSINTPSVSASYGIESTKTTATDTAASAAAGPTKIIVTEKVPGGDCTCIAEGAQESYGAGGMGPPKPGIGEVACGVPETRKYQCTVPQGMDGFKIVFAQIIRYFILIVLLLGVLGIVGLGMAWAFAGGDDVKMKTTLKHWGVNVLVGLILLFLFSYILMALAPWVFTS